MRGAERGRRATALAHHDIPGLAVRPPHERLFRPCAMDGSETVRRVGRVERVCASRSSPWPLFFFPYVMLTNQKRGRDWIGTFRVHGTYGDPLYHFLHLKVTSWILFAK